jgi:hypothetical protein
VKDDFDPGAVLCGHAPRAERRHYLGGDIWVCFDCLEKAVRMGALGRTQHKEQR